MLVEFLETLRRARLPVSTTEYLALLEALEADLAGFDTEDFYYLARTILVKDEKHLDRFDTAFAAYFERRQQAVEDLFGEIPEEWLRRQAELLLSDEEKQQLQATGDFDRLMELLRERLAEQQGRHQGGNKWIGTAGRSPFGAYGFNPEGVRIGQSQGRHGRAVKVWDRREFRNLDDDERLAKRNLKVVLRKLRRFARTGSRMEFSLDDTIRSTARNAGWLDVRMVPERHNAVKVLLFIDVGGSMYPYVQTCEQLFAAARSEFKSLEYFYFHNFFYERLWRDNRRRTRETVALEQILRTYPKDYKVIIVGDASMSPYEIAVAGGSVEGWNEEPGEVSARRLLERYPAAVWLNPVDPAEWPYTRSIGMVREIMEDRMFPLTVAGVEDAIGCLRTARR